MECYSAGRREAVTPLFHSAPRHLHGPIIFQFSPLLVFADLWGRRQRTIPICLPLQNTSMDGLPLPGQPVLPAGVTTGILP